MNITNIIASRVRTAGTPFSNIATGKTFRLLQRKNSDQHYNADSHSHAAVGACICRLSDSQLFFVTDKQSTATPVYTLIPVTHTLTVNEDTTQYHAVLDSVSATDSPNPAGHPAKLEVFVFALPSHAPVTIGDIITDTATGTRFRVRRVNATETTLQRVESVPV